MPTAVLLTVIYGRLFINLSSQTPIPTVTGLRTQCSLFVLCVVLMVGDSLRTRTVD